VGSEDHGEALEGVRRVLTGLLRPRRGITERHAKFLERQVHDPNTVALRTSNAFIIAQCRHSEGFIDDFAIANGGSWADDGHELLSAAWALGFSVRRRRSTIPAAQCCWPTASATMPI
jgi:hypothetical protein